MDDLKLPSFPVVTFLARRGSILAILAGISPVLAAIVAVFMGSHVLWMVGGFLTGLVLWLFLESYVEVLRILADALMPR